MFIIDDLGMMILEGIVDYTNSSYLSNLENYLKEIRLLYETGEIDEEKFKELEAEVTKMIKNLRAQRREMPPHYIDINIF